MATAVCAPQKGRAYSHDPSSIGDSRLSYLYPLKLTEEQELRAKTIHDQAIVIDMVNMGPGGSTIYEDPVLAEAITPFMSENENKLESFGMAQFLPYQLAASGLSSAIQQIWQESGLTAASTTWPSIDDQNIALFQTVFEPELNKLEWIEVVKSAADIRRCKQEGKHAMYWFCQPQTGVGLPFDLCQLDKAKEAGVLSLMLTYNSMDVAGVGCTERVDAGLSCFGVDVVKRCNELGIVVDVSHCGKMTTLDACKASTQPVTANHTCAAALYDCNRAKSDEEMKSVAETGGLVGIVAVPFFLTDQPSPTIEVMLDHIDYVVGLIGWQHVGLATDWPIQGPKELQQAFADNSADMGFRAEDKFTADGLEGLPDSRGLRNITRGLVARGYHDEEITGILGGNYLRILDQVQG